MRTLSEAGQSTLSTVCARKLMELTGTLKLDLLRYARKEMAAADRDMTDGEFLPALRRFGAAQKILTKIEEPSLSREAAKQKAVVRGRMDVACRNADRTVKRIKTILASGDVRYLTTGYVDILQLIDEAEQLYTKSGEKDKAEGAEALKPQCEQMQAASVQACAGDQFVETGQVSGSRYHFERAAEMYESARVILEQCRHRAFVDEMKKRAYAALEKAGELGETQEDDAVIGGGEALDKMEEAMVEYAAAMDGKEDVLETDVEQVCCPRLLHCL
jgi:hypothetical protein